MEETQDVGVELDLDFVGCTTKFRYQTSGTHLRAVLIVRLRQMEVQAMLVIKKTNSPKRLL